MKQLLRLILAIYIFYVFPNSMTYCADKENQHENFVQTDTAQTFEGGELIIFEGIPFLKLSGNYYEMGKQYGVLMKDKIRELYNYKKISDFVENGSYPPMWLVKWVTPDRYLDFIEGISDGSGIPYDEVFLINIALGVTGCSSVLLKDYNKILLGHNQDRWLPSRFEIIVEFNPDDAYKYILATDVGSGHVLMGMNEKGICIANNAGRFTTDGFGLLWPTTSYMPAICKYRQILESASCMEEVDELMDGYKTDGNILSVASGTEADGAIYDIAYKNLQKNPLEGKNYLYATNFYLNAVLNDYPEKCLRYQLINNHLQNKPGFNINAMIDILSERGTYQGVNNHITVNSIIFDPNEFQVYFAHEFAYAACGKWYKYDWIKDEFSVFRDAEPVLDIVSLKSFDSIKAASIRDTVNSDGELKLWSELYGFLNKDGIATAVPGFTIYHGKLEENNDVEIFVPVTELRQDTERIHFKIFPGSEVASILHKGPHEGLTGAYDYLYKWIEENNYKVNGPAIVCYLKSGWIEKNPDEWITEIRIPIKEKELGVK
ncbi:MAG: C45 family autoproteolytic acyltransferase/hydrolase [Ignavibacteria bacterium]